MAPPPANPIGLAARAAGDLVTEVRSLRLSGPTAAVATRAATAVTAAVLAAFILSMDNPLWAGISAARVIQGDARGTLRRGVDRLVGTLAGAVVGYVLAGVSENHLLVELGLFALAGFSVYGQARSAHGYVMTMLGVTTVLVVFSSLDAPDQALHIAVYRAIEVSLGVLIGCLVDFAAAPDPPPHPAAAETPPRLFGPIDGALLGAAITGGAAIALIPPIWSALQLPGLSQTPITAYVILAAAHDAQAWRAVNRIFGCLIGAAVGLLAIKLVGDAFIPWAVLLFAGVFVFAQIEHGTSPVAYVGAQAIIAFLITVVQGPAPSSDIVPGIDRLCGVLGGIAVAGAVASALAPLRARLERWTARPVAASDG